MQRECLLKRDGAVASCEPCGRAGVGVGALLGALPKPLKFDFIPLVKVSGHIDFLAASWRHKGRFFVWVSEVGKEI